ncbi:MAG: hypothetical protein ACRD16_05915 [Thermoanaerobaculia bacterium]
MSSTEMEEIKWHFSNVAEGLFSELGVALRSLDSRIDQRIDSLREAMDRGFAETQDLIRSLTP